MINGFNHTGVVVRDIDTMVRFYTEELGLVEEARFETDASVHPDHTGVPRARRVLVFLGLGDGHQLELVHYLEPPSGPGYLDNHQLGSMHVCFSVDDLTAAHEELSAKGIPFVTEPVFAATPDGGEWGVAYCQDPEGNYIEFIQL